jgi:hypothetical protein
MTAADRRAVRFVRLLIGAGEARSGVGGLFRASTGDRVATLGTKEVAGLVSAGVLAGDAIACRAAAGTANWLRRQLVETDPFQAQHRELRSAGGLLVNLAESPLGRLAVPAAGQSEPFLSPHQIEAGERLRRLVQRAQLQPRVTMSYDAARTASGSGAGPTDLSDMAADARRMLAELTRALPSDCAGVLLDVCGLEKGLQAIEAERGWPRRSAKLVLRIGLDQLARHFGLQANAQGPARSTDRAWMQGERPAMLAERRRSATDCGDGHGKADRSESARAT